MCLGDGTNAIGAGAVLAASLMQSPEMLAALQDKLGSMVGVPSGYIQRYAHWHDNCT